MFVRIDNTPRDYAWGSTTAIAALRGLAPSGGPEAELWLGAHPGSPARVIGEARQATGGCENLAEWIASDPVTALGRPVVIADEERGVEPHLPFLLKLLAAAGPLSLQAHPSPAQAREGFDRENAAGVPLDASDRNYKDPFHKPELIVALSETFDALCGFRSRAATLSDLARLTAADAASVPALAAFSSRLAAAGDDAGALRDAVAWLLGGGEEVAALVGQALHAARLVLDESGADDYEQAGALDPVLRPFATIVSLSDAYPGDPGVVISLLMNRVQLTRGQALYLPAGNLHAYLEGLGVELMAASDNVLRGGLTPKHIDIPELLSVLDFTPLPAPLLEPVVLGAGVETFRPDVPDFQLVHAVVGDGAGASAGSGATVDPAPASLPLGGPAIAVAVSGSMTLTGSSGALVLARGEAAYVTPSERSLALSGHGELFLATVNA